MLILPPSRVMASPKVSSVAPLASIAEPIPLEPRDFHFAVTWVTLFAQLDPIPSTGPRPRRESSPSSLALVPVVPLPLVEPVAPLPIREADAAWEMVVPKMIRTGTGNFTPVDNEAGPA